MTRRSAIVAALGAGALQAATFPRAAGKLAITTADGKSIDLQSYKGKVVVIEFLSTVCPSCQDCAQVLNRIQAEYRARGVQILGAATNPNPDTQTFINRFGLTFPVGTVTEDDARRFLQVSVMQPFMVPHLAFVDRALTVQTQRGGTEESFFQAKDRIIREELDKLLAAKTKS